MHGGCCLLFTVEGGDRRPCLAGADLPAIVLEQSFVARRRIRIALEVAGYNHRPGAEITEAFSIDIGLRNHQRQLGEQRFRNVVPVVPAVEGTV